MQRVAGKDLDKFDAFIQLFEFKGNFPTDEHYAPREYNVWRQLTPFVYPGMPRRFSRRYFEYQLNRLLRRPNPQFDFQDNRNELYYQLIKKQIDVDRGKFFIVPQNFQSVALTNILYKKHDIDYAAWIMDDHELRYSSKQGLYYTPKYETSFSRFLKNAKIIFVISENMREFYRARFGVESTVLFGPGDYVSLERPAVIGEKIKLCYFGAVWKWQNDAIIELSRKLNQLNATLDIYTFHEVAEEIRQAPEINVLPGVPASEVPSLMKQHDAVVIFYGFDDDVRPLSELNISTKLSECLASGIPTVLVGPEYGAMTRFGREHNCAVILSDLNDPSQIQSFKDLLSSPGAASDLLDKAKWVSENITSTKAMRQVWKAKFEEWLSRN